jgi:GGDEF domain-containing protein
VCEGIGEREAEQIAERIDAALEVPMLVDGEHVRVTASVGSASTCDSQADPAELLVRADQSMYRVKRTRTETDATRRAANGV